jgi:hypothetical protein
MCNVCCVCMYARIGKSLSFLYYYSFFYKVLAKISIFKFNIDEQLQYIGIASLVN